MFDISKCPKDKDGNLLAQTRDGRPVTLIATNGREPWPLMGYVAGESIVSIWPKDGVWGGDSDLINIPEPKRGGEVWVNIYDNSGPTAHYRRHCADYTSGEDPRSKRIASIRVEWIEGEGLEGK